MAVVHVGTSGWSYREWKGSFYPADLKNHQMLAYYGERFDSVEVNNTYYRLPTREVLEDWATQVPAGFSFVVKASRHIHIGPSSGPRRPILWPTSLRHATYWATNSVPCSSRRLPG